MRRQLLARGLACDVQVGADRGVAAGDVEADADDRDLVPVGGDAADRHDVAEVAVGHQRRALGAAGDVLELRERVRLVLAEDGDLCVGSHYWKGLRNSELRSQN